MDVAAARRNLFAWLREFGPDTADGSLLEFAIRSGDPVLRKGIYTLDSEGFRQARGQDSAGPAERTWSGREFWDQFEAWRRSWLALRREQKPSMTDLYAPANRAP